MNMFSFSLTKLTSNLKSVVIRFPLALFFSLVSTILLVIKIQTDSDIIFLDRAILISILSVILFTTISLFIEKRIDKLLYKIIFYAIGIIFVIIYLFIFLKSMQELVLMRYIVFIISIFFTIIFVGFLGLKDENNFELFSVKLFLRFFVTILFSGILFAGLSSAIATIDFLFAINFTEKVYFNLFVIVSGIFSIPYFLMGIPDKNYSYEEVDYPKVLKILIAYIFLPLV
ncbi:MAG TPA: DUF4153 domain-containing protein, partial [Spirochaetota bacterium]|nr:DUF4153 domain-containing protein [Spirochaetota bacterium]